MGWASRLHAAERRTAATGRALMRVAVLAAGVLLTAAPAWAVAPVCAPASGADALWTIADVDGDRAADVVRVAASTTRPAEPEIVDAACRVAIASDLARVLHGTLTARDLDADRDLDLVHLDAAGTPVRAWLNDGHGRFRAVSPEAAGPRLPQSRWRSFSSSSPVLAAWHTPRDRAAGDLEPLPDRGAPPRAQTLFIPPVRGARSAAWHTAGTRGPPRHAPVLHR